MYHEHSLGELVCLLCLFPYPTLMLTWVSWTEGKSRVTLSQWSFALLNIYLSLSSNYVNEWIPNFQEMHMKISSANVDWWVQGPTSMTFILSQFKFDGKLFPCNSILSQYIATRSCPRHDSTAIVTWGKIVGDRIIRIWMSKMKFLLHFSSDRNIVGKWFPGINALMRQWNEQSPYQLWIPVTKGQ